MSSTSPVFALNHVASPRLRFADVLRLAVEIGLPAVEIRNDLHGVEIEDGTPATEIRRAAETAGVEILSINALQRFNDWTETREREALRLAAYARDCGAGALVLCPVNAREDTRGAMQRIDDLRRSLAALAPILADHGILGLVEPLGFAESSLRLKRVAVEATDAVDGAAVFRLVHDTFHHFLAGETELFPGRTGLVHISGVEDRGLAHDAIRDAHRVLVGPGDRFDTVGQIRALLAGGYRGPFSFEPFAESVQTLSDQAGALRASMAFIRQGLARAA
jgi:2-keto-myo-inositol isomerase